MIKARNKLKQLKHLHTTQKTFQSTMVVTTNMEEFISNIRNERMNQFWNDTKKFQKFSPTPEEMVENTPPGTFDDSETLKISRHFKAMCNVRGVGGKRTARNSRISKSLVESCAADGIHIACSFAPDGTPYCSFNETQRVQPGDMLHMYYGDLAKNNSKHYVGRVLTHYEKFTENNTLEQFSEVNKSWPHGSQCALFCLVDWKEVSMNPDDEYMLKNPGKNGFKVQGTILRVR